MPTDPLAAFILKGKEAECIATHEYGHRIISRFMERGEAQKVADYINLIYKQHLEGWHTEYGFVGVGSEVSAYAASSWEEFWAESFCIYKCGDKERLPKDIRAMVGNVLACIRKETPHSVDEIENVTKLFRTEYRTLRKLHATVDSFGERHTIVDLGGQPIIHNEIPRIAGKLPDYRRERAEDHPEKVHDGVSNAPEPVKADQREKFRMDIERLQPGLADEAQRVYDAMDAKDAAAKVILIIHDTSSGSYVGHLSSTPADEEILFGCNQKFIIMGREKLGFAPIQKKDGRTFIHIKER